MKALIIDTGDPSVGIFEQRWEIDCPFDREDVEETNLIWFKEEMIKVYSQFVQGKIQFLYDFESVALYY